MEKSYYWCKLIIIIIFCTYCDEHSGIYVYGSPKNQTVDPSIFETFHVVVANRLPTEPPNPLVVHCQSKDDDIGIKTLHVNEQFQFRFKWGFRTLFFCHYWWGDKQAVFDVFNRTLAHKYCNNKLIPGLGGDTCYWETRLDGFYLAVWYDMRKLNNWNN